MRPLFALSVILTALTLQGSQHHIDTKDLTENHFTPYSARGPFFASKKVHFSPFPPDIQLFAPGSKPTVSTRARSKSQSTPKKTKKPICRTLTSELQVQINLECFDGSYMGRNLTNTEVLRYCETDRDGGGCVCVTGGLVRCVQGITTEKQQFCKSQCYCEIRRFSKF